MKKILFICLGNICRSATAEEVMRQKAALAGIPIETDSAGLIDYHEGELPDSRMRDHAFRRGYKLTHRSRPVRKADFAYFDLIIAMDEQNVRGLLRLTDESMERRKIRRAAEFIHHYRTETIPDPYYGGAEAFEHAMDLIEDCCDGLIEFLKKEAPTEASSPSQPGEE